MEKKNASNQELVIYEEEKQNELYEIIKSAFAEELKEHNCFILPEVGKRVGEILIEREFGRATRATFMQAPNYFKVGYNEKNAAAISLIGFPDDTNFTTSLKDEVVVSKKVVNNETIFDIKKQLVLERIVEKAYTKELKRDNCLLAFNLWRRIGKDLYTKGFGRTDIETFKKAPSCFKIGYNSKGDECIALAKYPLGQGFFTKEQYESIHSYDSKIIEFSKMLFVKLTKAFKTNDVSASNIFTYMKNNRIVFSEQLGSFEDLLDVLGSLYGEVTRSNGEGYEPERFITLRETLPIPKEVQEKVRTIIKEFYSDKDLVGNAEIGQALANNGISFKDYHYADLTGFLRYFSDILSIVPVPQEQDSKKISIFVRIKDELKNNDLFYEKILSLLENNKTEEILTQENVRRAMKINSISLWNLFFRALQLSEGVSENDIVSASNFEGSLIELDEKLIDAVKNGQNIDAMGFDIETQNKITEYITKYSFQKPNFSTTGLRLQTICGAENYIAYLFFKLGMIAKVSYSNNDKWYCFRHALTYCARFNEKEFYTIWESGKEEFLKTPSLFMLMTDLFILGKYDYVIRIYETRPEKITSNDSIYAYYCYANLLIKPSERFKFCPLNSLDVMYAKNIVLNVLDYAEQTCDFDMYLGMLFNCIDKPEDYCNISQIHFKLTEHKSYLLSIKNILEEKASNQDYIAWIVLKKLFAINIFDDADTWDKISTQVKQTFSSRYEASDSLENLEFIKEFALFFPEDDRIIKIHLEHINRTLSTMGNDDFTDFIRTLWNNSHYVQITKAYEENLHRDAFKIPEVLDIVSNSYYKQQNFLDAIKTKSIRLAIDSNSEELKLVLAMLYEGFIEGSLLTMDSVLSNEIYNLFTKYECDKSEAHQFCYALMGLALRTQKYGLLSILFTIAEIYNDSEEKFVATVEKEIQESNTGYNLRLPDLFKIYEYLITTESMENIFDYLGKAANALRSVNISDGYSQYYKSPEQVDSNAMTRLLISDNSEDRAWKLLSKYAVDNNRSALNYVANIIWLFKFKDTSYPLTNCTRAVDKFVDASLPTNFLELNVSLLKNNLRIDGYWEAFAKHIETNNSFSNASKELAVEYLNILSEKKMLSIADCNIVIEIVKQCSIFREFCSLFLNENEKFISSILEKSIVSVKLLSVLVFLPVTANDFSVIENIQQIRSRINVSIFQEKEYMALLWVDELIKMRMEFRTNNVFFEASKAIFNSYPLPPQNDIINKFILPKEKEELPDIDVLRNWFNIFGSMGLTLKVQRYMQRKPLPENKEDKIKYYKIKAFVLKHSISYYTGSTNEILRVCKNFLAMKYLADENLENTELFQQKMINDLTNEGQIKCYEEYEKAFYAFIAEDIHSSYKEQILYCGTTNFWDDFISEVLLDTDILKDIGEPLLRYLSVLDYRSYRRRIVQTYLYTLIASDSKYSEFVSYFDEKHQVEANSFAADLMNEQVDSGIYLSSIAHLAKITCPEIGRVLDKLVVDNDSITAERIKSIIYVLSDRKMETISEHVDDFSFDTLKELTVPCIAALRFYEDVIDGITKLIFSCNEKSLCFLENNEMVVLLGEFLKNYLYTVYYVNSGNFDTANEWFKKMGSCPLNYEDAYNNLKNALDAKMRITIDDFHLNESRKKTSLKFSFVKSEKVNDATFQQLISEFYSTTHYNNAKEKCFIAAQIHTLLLSGTPYNDSVSFYFKWGFYEIDSAYDFSEKMNILLELIEHMHNLNEYESLKDAFVENYVYILNEIEFNAFAKNFNQLNNCYKILHSHIPHFNNKVCYDELLMNLDKLHKISNDYYNSENAELEMNAVKSHILNVHVKYPQNRFASKCIEFADRYIQQMFENRIFEIKILNENMEFSDIIFYQIKNVGFEAISEVTLTFGVDGFEESTYQININSEIHGKLRPGQCYAGEYIPNINVQDGKEITCTIFVVYKTKSEDEVVEKSYIAVDANQNGTLNVVKNDCIPYIKRGRGYIGQTIDNINNFIKRDSITNNIMGNILGNCSVLLHGPNGTGKSSLLNVIAEDYIPDAFAKAQTDVSENLYGASYYVCEITPDIDCTEKALTTSLIEAFLSTNDSFEMEVKSKLSEDLASKLDFLTSSWEKKMSTLFDDEGHCPDSGAIRKAFENINKYVLKPAKIHAYLIIDQFERVVSSKNINPQYMIFLRDLTCSHIRFILAGSNKVNETVSVSLEDGADDSWSDVFSRGVSRRIKVGNLEFDEFNALLEQREALNNGEIRYSDEAIKYFWNYTKGHAYYSALIGNRTLDILNARKVKRQVIYPSDIFAAIYQSDKYISFDESNQSNEKAINVQIFKDISDDVVVKYVGKVLALYQADGENRITYKKWNEMVKNERPDLFGKFNYAVEVLLARDFICYAESTGGQEYDGANREYCFTSDLYLENFLNAFIPQMSEEIAEKTEKKKRTIDELVPEISMALYDSSSESIEKFKKIFGSGNFVEKVLRADRDIVEGDNTTNYQINIAYNIASTFNSILSADGKNIASLLSSLPRLSNFIEKSEDSEKLDTLFGQLAECNKTLSDEYYADEDEVVEIKGRQEKIEEQISTIIEPAITEMHNTYKNALIVSEDNVDDFVVWKSLGFNTKESYDLLTTKLEPEFIADLYFAAKLDYLFAGIKDDMITDENTDFSPVSIMYCKLVEKMLKHYHTDIYIEKLEDASTQRYVNDELVKFGDLSNEKLSRIVRSKIMIGAFLWPIKKASNNIGNIEVLSGKDFTLSTMWQEHGDSLEKIGNTRNDSAHGSKNKINLKRLLNLKKWLFKENELARIVELSVAHQKGSEYLREMQEEDSKMLELLKHKNS